MTRTTIIWVLITIHKRKRGRGGRGKEKKNGTGESKIGRNGHTHHVIAEWPLLNSYSGNVNIRITAPLYFFK